MFENEIKIIRRRKWVSNILKGMIIKDPSGNGEIAKLFGKRYSGIQRQITADGSNILYEINLIEKIGENNYYKLNLQKLLNIYNLYLGNNYLIPDKKMKPIMEVIRHDAFKNSFKKWILSTKYKNKDFLYLFKLFITSILTLSKKSLESYPFVSRCARNKFPIMQEDYVEGNGNRLRIPKTIESTISFLGKKCNPNMIGKPLHIEIVEDIWEEVQKEKNIKLGESEKSYIKGCLKELNFKDMTPEQTKTIGNGMKYLSELHQKFNI